VSDMCGLPALMAELRMVKDCIERARDQLEEGPQNVGGAAYADDQCRRAAKHLAQIPVLLRAMFGEMLELAV